jgi:hypothetical protein
MTEMQYELLFFRATYESNHHNIGLYCQFQRSRGDGMSVFVSIQHEMS